MITILLDTKFGVDLIDILGLHFPESEKFKPYQIVSYMFMHGSFSHILFNMLAVWMFGSALESYWGQKRFLIYYIITGIGAAVIHYGIVYYEMLPTLNYIDEYLANPSIEKFDLFLSSEYFNITSVEMQAGFSQFRAEYYSLLNNGKMNDVLQLSAKYVAEYKVEYLNAPTIVGASGSLFGLLLAYGMLFPNQVIYVYLFFSLKAKYFVILYGAIELFSGFYDNTSNVAHFAHLGGMLFGFILIKIWGNNRNNYSNF